MISFALRRRLLYGLSLVLLVLAVVVIITGFSLPLREAEQDSLRVPAAARRSSQQPTVETGVALESFAQHWDKSLHRPLVDPPAAEAQPVAVAPAPPPPPPPPFRGTLIGTLVDANPSERRAWIRFGNEPARIVCEGEQLADQPGKPQIMVIGADIVRIEIGGQSTELRLNRDYSSILARPQPAGGMP